MKKFTFFFSFVILVSCFSSCSLAKYSSRQNYVNNAVVAASVADMDVSMTKIHHTYIPPKSVKSLGYDNVLNAGISEACKNNDADVLVGTQFVFNLNSFGKVKSVEISGYPAKYKNFHPIPNDAVDEAIISANVNNTVLLNLKKRRK